jgi:hypothetical protein
MLFFVRHKSPHFRIPESDRYKYYVGRRAANNYLNIFDPSRASSLRPVRRKNPSNSLAGTARPENLENTIPHWNAPPRFGSLALRIEHYAVVAINVLNAHSAYFGNIPHAGIAHDDEDVLKRLTQKPHRLASATSSSNFSRRISFLSLAFGSRGI